ncbi:uncharacterized protein I206_101248 [Kwoniella pini CBS 10737]|uniref:Calpain catalytic domain-containing protein n=1 Tax=Kwoniella pini CBS 10737 TaxID=1296096 RepID=A0AAJ8L1L7_9TREE
MKYIFMILHILMGVNVKAASTSTTTKLSTTMVQPSSKDEGLILFFLRKVPSSTYKHWSIGATSTISPPEITSNSAPIAGKNKIPTCDQLLANNPEEDWLFASLCSWSNSNYNGTLSSLDFSTIFEENGNENELNLTSINVTLYDGKFNLLDSIILVYNGVKDNGNSNANEAWWGGSIRNSLLYYKDSNLIFNENFKKDEIFREWAGYYILINLLGINPIRENPSQINDLLWEMYLDKSSFTPITILSKKQTSFINSNRYFSIINFNKTNSNYVELWDPTAGGNLGFFTINIEDLKNDVKWLFHLDWPRYYAIPRKV